MKNIKREVEWNVYGPAGKEQMETYEPSLRYDFSTKDYTRIIEVDNYDKTGTHEYAVIRIICDTYNECYKEISGQITDGIFENYNVGEVKEICAGFSGIL